MIALLVHLVGLLIVGLGPLLIPVAIIVVMLRVLGGPLLRGSGGVVAEFLVRLFVLPFQLAWWLLRGVWAFWCHSRSRHVRIKHPRRRAWLATLAQRFAARQPRQSAGPLMAPDDPDRRPGSVSPDYPKDEFEGIWQAHLRALDRRQRWPWRWWR